LVSLFVVNQIIRRLARIAVLTSGHQIVVFVIASVANRDDVVNVKDNRRGGLTAIATSKVVPVENAKPLLGAKTPPTLAPTESKLYISDGHWLS